MSKYISILILILHFTTPVAADTERGIVVSGLARQGRTELVIGNSKYMTSPLKNPANDSIDMASALNEARFDVTLKVNATQREMEDAIKAFGKKLRTGGIGLFYFAGHGIQINGRNYLLPVDAKIESESDVKYEAVNAGLVLGKMEDAGNDLNIVIFDACRDNRCARGFRSAEEGLAKIDSPTGSLIAYATAPGSIAADGKGRNGLYTQYLLKYINQPGLKVEDVFKKVRLAVAGTTSKRQIPWESSSLIGDFYFFGDKDTAALQRPQFEKIQSTGLDQEREKIERERLELERMRIEIERTKLEEERRIQVVKKARANAIQFKTTTWLLSGTNYASVTKDLSFDVGLGNAKWGYGFAGTELKKANILMVDVEAPTSYKHYDSNSFAGFIIDYHTREGYVKRIMLGIGMLDNDRWDNGNLAWGRPEKPQLFLSIGHASTYRLDLQQWAPNNWDGKIWFAVGIQNAGKKASIQAQLRIINKSEQ